MNFTINKGIRKCTEFYKSTQDESKVNYSDLNALFSTALFGNNLSETVKCAPWTRSESSISRSAKNFNTNRFMRRYRSSILKRLKKDMLIDPK